MIDFPVVPSGLDLPVPRMQLRDYALFSEHCLKSNPFITSANCLVKRASEKAMPRPFHLSSKNAGGLQATASHDIFG